jgi:hypothetical protein
MSTESQGAQHQTTVNDGTGLEPQLVVTHTAGLFYRAELLGVEILNQGFICKPTWHTCNVGISVVNFLYLMICSLIK